MSKLQAVIRVFIYTMYIPDLRLAMMSMCESYSTRHGRHFKPKYQLEDCYVIKLISLIVQSVCLNHTCLKYLM